MIGDFIGVCAMNTAHFHNDIAKINESHSVYSALSLNAIHLFIPWQLLNESHWQIGIHSAGGGPLFKCGNFW